MFNAKEMLGQLLGGAQGMAAQAGNQQGGGSLLGGLGGLLGGGGQAALGGGGLLGGLGSLLGGGQAGGSQAGGGLLGGLGNVLKDPKNAGLLGGGGGLLAGLLLGNKSAGGIGSKLAAAGGAAALGSIALKAFKTWQSNRAAQPAAAAQGIWQQAAGKQAAAGLDFDNLPDDEQEDRSRAMLAAIIAAAKADGTFDEREREMIEGQLAQIGDKETTEWVQTEIRKPLDPERVAAMATSPEMATEIYLASLMVIDDQNERERTYLDTLAKKMGMDAQLQQELEKQLAGAAA